VGTDLRRRESSSCCHRNGAVDEYLVRRDDGLVLLFTPPFDQTPLDPGYIKGYPPAYGRTAANTRTPPYVEIAFPRFS